MKTLTLDALLALAERGAAVKNAAAEFGLHKSEDFFDLPRAIFDALPNAEAEQRIAGRETWARASMIGGVRVSFFTNEPPDTPQNPRPAEPGDVCPSCAMTGVPGGLCPHHAAAGILAVPA